MRLKYVKLVRPVQSPEFPRGTAYSSRDEFTASDTLTLDLRDGWVFIDGPHGCVASGPCVSEIQLTDEEAEAIRKSAVEKPAAKARAK